MEKFKKLLPQSGEGAPIMVEWIGTERVIRAAKTVFSSGSLPTFVPEKVQKPPSLIKGRSQLVALLSKYGGILMIKKIKAPSPSRGRCTNLRQSRLGRKGCCTGQAFML